MITRGSEAFKALRKRGTLREWSALLGVSVQSVADYASGDTAPNDAMTERIEEYAEERGVDLPKEWWAEPISKAEALAIASDAARVPGSLPPDADVSPATSDDTARLSGQLKATIQRLQDALNGAAGAAYELDKQARIAGELAGAIAKLGQLTGVRLTERAILSSPLWAELIERIAAALEPWPDALRAVAAVLTPAEKDPKA